MTSISRLTTPAPRPKAAPSPTPSDFDALLTMTHAVDVIGRLVKAQGEADRTSKDKVRKRVSAAILAGDLKADSKGAMRWGEVLRWARTKREWLEALAVFPPVGTTHQAAGIGPNSVFGTPRVVPSELPDCRAQLQQAWEQVRKLEEMCSTLEKKVAELQPLAERREEVARLNRRNARIRNK